MCRHAAGGACGNVPILDAMFTELFLIARYNSMLTSNIFIDFGRVERPAGSTRSSRLHRPSPPLWFVYKALHNTESLHIKQTCIRKLYIPYFQCFTCNSVSCSALYAKSPARTMREHRLDDAHCSCAGHPDQHSTCPRTWDFRRETH